MGDGSNGDLPPPARIHLLPAREAPVVVVIRRKPSRTFHILRWSTETDVIEAGSWFYGRLYEMRSDVSFDGKWMTYFARGNQGTTWTGLCRPPILRTVVHWEDSTTYAGGGVFATPDLLLVSCGHMRAEMRVALSEVKDTLPFRVEEIPALAYGGDVNVLHRRFERDGFRPLPSMGIGAKVTSRLHPGWERRPSPAHPVLWILNQGDRFEFYLPDFPRLITPDVTWAAYDALGQLVFARRGVLYRYTVEGIRSGEPAAVIDLESLTPPGGRLS